MIKLKLRFVADYRWINIYSEKLKGRLKKASKKAAELIADRIRKNILEGKRYDGKRVAKLLPSTIRRKGGDNRPLIHSLTLYNSIDVKELDTSYKVHVKPLKGRFSSRTPRDMVARILQSGAPSKNLKARPFFGTTKGFVDKIDKELKKAFDA